MMVFGPHPDDCEIGAGGIIALHTHKGYDVGICNLSIGELSTNGDIKTREEEAKKASEILKIKTRVTANLPDGFIEVKEKYLKIVIEIIRKYRPKIILAPYYEDPHPDHSNGSKLIRRAAHLSGLREYPAEGERFRPKQFYYYFLGNPQNPGLVVNTSGYETAKLESIAAYESQLGLNKKVQETSLTEFDLLKRIESRDRYMGYFINSEFGEGLIYEKAIGTKDLFTLGG